MKVLVDASFTSSSLVRCSSHYQLWMMVKHALDRIPDLYIYYLLPEDGGDWDTEGCLPNDPRIKTFRVPCFRDRFKEFLLFKKELADRVSAYGDIWDWDVCLTNKTLTVPQMKLVSGKLILKSFVIMEPMPVVSYKKTVTLYRKDENLHYLTWAGYLAADLVVVNAMHEIKGIIEEARRFLTPAKLLAMSNKMVCAFPSPLKDGFDPAFPETRSRTIEGPLRVVYPQRLDKSERRPDLVIEVFNKLFISESGVRFEIFTNSSESLLGAALEKAPFVVGRRPKRQEFWDRLKGSHVFLSWAMEEGWPLSVAEATMLGVIGVVKSENWSRCQFGEDYPWLVGTTDEAVAKIKQISRDYAGAYEKWLNWYKSYFLPKIQKYGNVDEMLTTALLARQQKLLEIGKVKSENERDDVSITDMVRKNVAMLGQRRFKLLDVLQRLKKWGDAENTFGGDDWDNVPLSRSPSLYDMKVKLVSYGWKDGPEIGELYKTPDEFFEETGRRVE